MDVPTDTRPREPSHPSDSLSPVEQEILDEYAKLVGNLNDVKPPNPIQFNPIPFGIYQSLVTDTVSLKLSGILAELAANPSASILDALRGLERKTTTVFTLLKASVYSIVLQQEIFGDEQAGGEEGMRM